MYASHHIIAGIAITLLLVTLMPMAFANHCGVDEFHTPTNTCEDDNESPELLVDGTAGDRTINILVGSTYTHLPHTVTDNDPNYNSPFATITVTPSAVDTSRPGTFTVEYMAEGDIAGNGVNLVILVTVIVSCPTGQLFIGTACITPEFDHVLSFGVVGNGDGQISAPDGITANATHIHIVDSGNNRVQIFDYDGNYAGQFGSFSGTVNPPDGQFNNPVGIATTSTRIFVSDPFNARIQIFDNSGNHVKSFGSKGSGNGQFSDPRGITTNGTHLLVADAGNNRIQFFDLDGNYVSKITALLNRPSDVATNSTHIFVIDTNNNNVRIFDNSGNLVKSFGSFGNGTGAFSFPRGIATTPTNIFVADSGNHRVQIFDINGNYVSEFGGTGSGPRGSGNGTGEFNGLQGITTFNTFVFVSDTSNNRVQVFKISPDLIQCPAGQIITTASTCITDNAPPLITVNGSSETRTIPVTVGEPYTVSAGNVTDNDESYSGTVTSTIAPGPIDTSRPRVFTITYNATADATGNAPAPVVLTIIVSCLDNQAFIGSTCITLEFDHVLSFGSGGSGNGEFNIPVGIVTNFTHLFIVDAVNSRIQIFDDMGNYVSKFGGTGPDVGGRGSGDGEFRVPVGIATNNTHLFVADNQNHRIQIFDFNGNFVAKFGGMGDGNGEFTNPQAIATNSTHLIVADTGNHRIQIFDHTGVYVSQFGRLGTGDGEFNGTEGIATNNTHIFIADRENHRIQIFDNAGNYVAQFGGLGDGDGQINFPRDIITTFTHLYVVESLNHRVQIFDINGNYLSQFGSGMGSADGEFNQPRGIATNGTHLYVVDSGNNRAQVFTLPPFLVLESCLDRPADNRTNCRPDTTLPVIKISSDTRTFLINSTYVEPSATVTDNDPDYSGTISATPSTVSTASPGSFTVTYTGTPDAAGNTPIPVAINIIVSCPPNQISNGTACVPFAAKHILTINMTGNVTFSEPAGITTNNTHVFVVARNSGVIIFDINGNFVSKFGSSGTGNGQFKRPEGITTTPDHIFIVDRENHRVQVFDHNGNYVRQFGSMGTANGEFRFPQGITTNGTHLFVTDQSNHRIQIFDVAGNHVKSFGSNGRNNGQFNSPSGITTDGIRLFVTEDNGARVQIFDTNGNHVKTIGDGVVFTGDGDFQNPNGIITTSTHIYVADTNNNRIQIFDHNGNYVDQFGSLGTADGQFNKPRGIATNYTHHFVADTDNNRIQIFQLTANLISCPIGQIFDGVTCYTPEAFEFTGIKSTYLVGEPFTGTLGFPSGIAATYTITDGALDGITLNNNGTWDAQLLTSTNLGDHTIQVTAAYQVNGADRQYVESFSFNVIEACTDDQLFNGTACFVFAAKPVLSFGSGSGNADGEFNFPAGIITNNTHIFVVDGSNGRVQIFDNVGNFVAKFGEGIGIDAEEFNFPIGITTNGTHLYIVDTSNHKIQIWDINGNYISEFGGSGSGAGQFSSPEGITTNNTHLFVADTDNSRIQIFDITGNHVKSFGGSGSGAGQFNSLSGIATNNTHLFVTDTGNHRVQIFDITGNHVKSFGGNGDGTGQFNTLAGITTTLAHIYIADNWNHRIQIFDINGEYVDQFGSLGTGVGEFKFPQGITTNSTHLFVADTSNHRVQIFELASNLISCTPNQILDSTGTCISDTAPPTITVSSDPRTFLVDETYVEPSAVVADNDPAYSGTISATPSSINTTSPGTFNVTYTASADAAGNIPLPVVITVTVSCPTAHLFDGNACISILEHVLSFGSSGAGTLTGPSGITTTATHIFIVNTAANNIQIFDINGNHVKSFGSSGNANGQFAFPNAIATNNTHLFVSDPLNNRIQIFDVDGNYIAQFGSSGNANGQFGTPIGIATNSTHLFVVDRTNHRIQIFDINGNYVSQFGSGGDADGQFNNPREIAVTSTNIFVSDTRNHRVQILDINGNYISQFGSEGSADGQFDNPYGITTNNTHIFVADRGNNRVQIFDIDGTYISQISGSSDVAFSNPHAITTNSTHLFIVDQGNSRVQVFEFASIVACINSEIRTTAGCITDSAPPVITVTGPSSVTILQNSTYTVLPPTIFDIDPSYDGSFTASSTTSPLDTSTIETVTITYMATDPSNNIGTATQSIDIVAQCPAGQVLDSAGVICIDDTDPPVIMVTPTTLSFRVGEAFTPPTVNLTDNDPAYSGTITNSTSPSGADTNSAGNYTITYSASADAAGNSPVSVVVTVTVTACTANQILVNGTCIVDNDPPVIMVTPTEITLQIGETFTLPTATISDNDPDYSGAVTANPSTIDTNSTGTHTITYSASNDASGNAPISVTVTVEIVDNDPPVIMVTPTEITLQIGETFTLPTATISDNDPDYSGAVTANPSIIDTSSAGIHTITYSAPNDASDNEPISVTVTVTVTACDANQILVNGICVIDAVSPVITVSSNQTIFLLGTTFIEPIVTISDNNPAYSGTVSNATSPGPVDTSSAGNYTITYNGTADASGNTPELVEIIIEVVATCPRDTVQDHFRTCIIDTIPPTITIPGPRSVTVLVGSNYTLPNATISDNDLAYNAIATPASMVDTSSVETFTIIYDGLPDASENIPISIVLTVIVAERCPAGQAPNSDSICMVSRISGGSSSSEWKTKPTFGLSWENNQPFVSSGFTLNDHTLDITNNWHTSFVPVNGVIGKENNAKIKVYAPKELSTVMLSLGVPEVGKVNDAEANILVTILPNYTGTISYTITGISHEQRDSLVDEAQTTATLSKSLCNDSDIIQKCYTVDINFVVLAPLKSDPVAITAIDTKNRYTTTYINEGLTFAGDSMLEPTTAQLVVKKGNQYDAETIDLIQQDRRHNLWEDQYGNIWSQNDHETWIQLTFPENTPTDSYVNVMTRMHTAFDSRVDVHTQNMESIRDSMYKDVYTDNDQ